MGRLEKQAWMQAAKRTGVEDQGQKLQENLVAQVVWLGYTLNWDAQTPNICSLSPPRLSTGIMEREYSVSLNWPTLDQGTVWVLITISGDCIQ